MVLRNLEILEKNRDLDIETLEQNIFYIKDYLLENNILLGKIKTILNEFLARHNEIKIVEFLEKSSILGFGYDSK